MCRIVHSKVSGLSDITLFNMRFLCPLHLIVPQYLSLVEINKREHFNEEKYFFVSDFLAIRLVFHKPTNISDKHIVISIELYLLSL